MSPTVKNVLAVIAGLIAGSVINGFIIMLSSSVIPPPPGVDVTSAEGLKSSMHLFQPRHFIMPFLAHAIGTFAGAAVAAAIAATRKMRFAMVISYFFLAGGIINVFILPAPLWFAAVDLLFAYLPMGYLAGRMAERRTGLGGK